MTASGRWRLRLALAVGAALAAAACTETFAPVTVLAPDSIVAQARSLTSAQLDWLPVGDVNVLAYRVERRTDFTGAWETVAENIGQTLGQPLFFLDDRLEPETFYGYRIRVVDRFGGLSEPSVVRGVRTPPRPSILLETVSRHEASNAADGDGYAVVIRHNGDSVVGPVAPNGARRFGPLTPGTYQVEILGLAANCRVDNGTVVLSAEVTDIGLATMTRVQYLISCTDPLLGRVTAVVGVTGENRDSTGYLLRLDGIHQQAPESLRITSDSARFDGLNGGVRQWVKLRPGDFQVTLHEVDPKCSADATTRAVNVAPMSDDTVRFAVTCPDRPPPDTNPQTPGYQLRNIWSPISAGMVTLTVTVDMAAYEDPAVNGNDPDDAFAFQGATRFDGTRLRFVDAGNVTGSGLRNVTANGATPGVINWLNFSTRTTPQTGQQGLALFTFEVLSTSGTVTTTTTIDKFESRAHHDLRPHTVIRESVLDLTGGGGANQPPRAEANGPYSGSAGSPISFSSTGSTDPNGPIASYAWTFGDNTSSSAANPQHAYGAAGSYKARLTVTDGQGLSATDSATVTVTSSGGTNQPPVANANGPYFGSVGTPVNFNSAGSSDPDGTIATYAWTFGDGGAGSGATAQHTYAVPGTYTAGLTVTDNLGAAATSTAQVNVSATQPTTSFTWRYVWSGTPQKDSIVALTVELDLSTDIPQTPGIEELQTFVVDSLKWNPAVLSYFSFNHGPGGSGSVQPTAAPQGKLSFQGTLGPQNRTGVIQIAVVRFRVLGNPGAATTTATALGALTGTPATGSFSYRSRTGIVEATLTAQ